MEFPVHSLFRYWRHSVPWDFVEGHRKTALKNHNQTLEKLAARGGLSPMELFLLVTDRSLAAIADLDTDTAVEELDILLMAVKKPKKKIWRPDLLICDDYEYET